ncbi:uncharacterized protein LOC127260737 isoform X2 [Andrographis paniculata]|uniref:uncharacterized protein LOC127260737 isoform X2 n=1 Tax=Andrographis paniculata TaxID=175694 RepID=UPI0021E87F71|nr:uncharacterized protein LOC127260737 isoform X2 [Andrographis paniculata]
MLLMCIFRFLPHLETDLNSFSESPESTIRFLAMLAGPFYPILQIVGERETARLALNSSDVEASKTNLPSTALMVSSNFEPRRSRNTSSVYAPMSTHLVFRPDAVFVLLRKAYKDTNLGNVCKMGSQIFMKLVEPLTTKEVPTANEVTKSDPCFPTSLPDYSSLFGEDFQIPDNTCDPAYLSSLDSAAIEEGIMHVLYASASQPSHCSKLTENASEFWLVLPLVQALLSALRPTVSNSNQIDDNFSPWKQSFVQNALSQIVATSSSAIYRPLLRACAGYLASFSPSHAKAACVLIDLCSGVLAPWMTQVIAKVDLCMELLEDLLGVIQGVRHSFSRARAALKYIVLALSGNMDDIIAQYKDAKHRILFLVEMLEPFLDPALTPFKGMISFGNMPSIFTENQEQNCARALNAIRTAIRKSSVLPSLESEWRHGSVAPSVLLSVLDAQLQLPADIDSCKFSSSEKVELPASAAPPMPSRNGVVTSRSYNQETADMKVDVDVTGKMDAFEDAGFFFAPPELNGISLTRVPSSTDIKVSDPSSQNINFEAKNLTDGFSSGVGLDSGQGIEFYNLLADYSQLMNYRDCELRASEFRRLALDLSSRNDITPENHDVAIDALLLAAECYINPCFMMSFKDFSPDLNKFNLKASTKNYQPVDVKRLFKQKDDLKHLADIERKRDRVVLEILIEAAVLDKKHRKLESELHVEVAEDVVNLSEQDFLSADAITLARQNQALLCNFLIERLLRDSHEEQQPVHEILMWCLLFLLHSATKLFCPPEHVVDIILGFSESLNMQLKSLYYQLKEESLSSNNVKQYELQRRWILLHRLIIASSGGDERFLPSVSIRNGFRFSNLVPPSAWLQKVPLFSSSAFPLVRYFGWMAVAHHAKQFLKERLFLVSDLQQLMYLLSIFLDDLSLVDNLIEQKDMDSRVEQLSIRQNANVEDGGKNVVLEDGLQSFHALHPDISKFFPNLKKEFIAFGETILEAVRLQLIFLSPSIVPDLMCWFSDLCSWPLVRFGNEQTSILPKADMFKGFVAKNAKAVILYILETIVVEHMEAMIPELPRVMQVLVSLCNTSYCDVSFLDSALCLLKPIITYSLSKVPEEENPYSSDNFESLCFGALFDNIKFNKKNEDGPLGNGKCQALTIYVLGAIFSDLSFHWKKELLQYSILWAEFASFEGTNAFHDYICAYQLLMDNCSDLLLATSRAWGIIPLKMSAYCDTTDYSGHGFSESSFLYEICQPSSSADEKCPDDNSVVANANHKICQLTLEEVKTFSEHLDSLVLQLNPTFEQCWKLHHKVTKKLALTCAECFILSRCLCLSGEKFAASSGVELTLLPSGLVNELPELWRESLRGLSETILVLQEKHCWEVASVLLESLLGVPRCLYLDNLIDNLCLALKNFSNSAPNISWRLQIDKMMALLLGRGINNICQKEFPLVDLFCALLGHAEPEQRYIALKHLGRLVGQDVDSGKLLLPLATESIIAPSDLVTSTSEAILSPLVSATWDHVALISSSDTSLLLKTHATALLINFIPFVERCKLQSFLAASDSILQSLTTLAQPTCDGPLTQFSLALIASACLYSPAEDMSLIPESIWRNIEAFGMSRNGSYCTSLEKQACEALCRLKHDGEDAKQTLKEVLCSSSEKQQIPDFVATRESILQVIGNLTSARSYFDFFSKEAEQKNMELEEAELEMELLQSEHSPSDSSPDLQDWRQFPFMSTYSKDDQRLQQIKDEIKSIEKAKLREEIVALRQQKLMMRRARQQFREEAALREAELVQKLHRSRADEVEKELKRQQQLELERAKTRELQHNLDMEKEKQAQRDIQREIEQVEAGVRPSRREFSSSSHSRARDKYRERESSRDGNEGSLRTTTRNMQPDTLPSTATTVVLPGARSFSGQPPTILQSRERSDDSRSNYEENFEGSKDSGDTGSVGDLDAVSSLDGQPIGFGRHGPRGGKSRQIMERRERGEGRREGKWERKH